MEDIDQADQSKQIDIFNLYNKHKAAHKKLLVTGNNNPNKMMLRDDLASRLSWGLVYKLNLLSDIEKKLALNRYSKDRGLNLKVEIIEYINTNDKGFENKFIELLNIDRNSNENVEEVVRSIIQDVKTNGDSSLISYTNKFDKNYPESVCQKIHSRDSFLGCRHSPALSRNCAGNGIRGS